MLGKELIWSDKLNHILEVISKMNYYEFVVLNKTFSFGVKENNKESSKHLLN